MLGRRPISVAGVVKKWFIMSEVMPSCVAVVHAGHSGPRHVGPQVRMEIRQEAG